MKTTIGIIVMLGLILVAPSGVWAEESVLQLSASGEHSLPADFLQVNVSVRSTCYKTATLAEKANGDVAGPIHKVMLGLKTKEVDEASASGPMYLPNESRSSGRTGEVICRGWTVTNSLTLRLHGEIRGDKVADILDSIIEAGASAFEAQPEGKGPATEASLSMGAGASMEKEKELNREATKRATLNLEIAKNELIAACGIEEQHLQLKSLSKGESYSGGPQYFQSARSSIREDVGSPISPSRVSRTVTLSASWTFVSPPNGKVCRLNNDKKGQP